MAVSEVAAGASSSAPSARDGRCTSFSPATEPVGLGPCANTTAPCATSCAAWRGGSTFASPTLPTWGHTCTSCCERGAAMRFRVFCDRLRASSLGGSRGQEGPTQAGASSPAWLGRVSLTGVATSWACGTMSFATKSKGPRAREFAKPSRMARLERSTHRSQWRRDHRLRDLAFGLAFTYRGRLPNCIGDLAAGPVSLKGSPMI